MQIKKYAGSLNT